MSFAPSRARSVHRNTDVGKPMISHKRRFEISSGVSMGSVSVWNMACRVDETGLVYNEVGSYKPSTGPETLS